MKPHQERITREYIELHEKRNLLVGFINRYHMGKLGFTPDSPIGVLYTQISIMDSYLSILKYRAEVEGFIEEFESEFNKYYDNEKRP